MPNRDSTKLQAPEERPAGRYSRRTGDMMDRTESTVRRSKRGPLRGRSRGQSLVEFSLILPVLVIMVLGIVDFGVGLRSYISLTNAAREGARFAAVGNAAGSYPANCTTPNTTTTIGRVCTVLEGLDKTQVQTVTVTYPQGQSPGNSVIVSAEYRYHYITPIHAVVSFFSGGGLPDYITLNATTDMRLE